MQSFTIALEALTAVPRHEKYLPHINGDLSLEDFGLSESACQACSLTGV